MMKWILVSVFEREIVARMFDSYADARLAMMMQLREEYAKDLDAYNNVEKCYLESMWDNICKQDSYNDGNFGFDEFSAYSNLDSSCNCDWKIFATGEIR